MYTSQISKILNRIIKTCLFRPMRYPTELIYKEFNVMNFSQLYVIRLIKCLDTVNFSQNHEIQICTRQNYEITMFIEKPNFQHFKMSPLYLGAKLFNFLPPDIRCKFKNKRLFYKCAKNWLLSSNYLSTTNLANNL